MFTIFQRTRQEFVLLVNISSVGMHNPPTDAARVHVVSSSFTNTTSVCTTNMTRAHEENSKYVDMVQQLPNIQHSDSSKSSTVLVVGAENGMHTRILAV